MRRAVFVCLSITIIKVASNPVALGLPAQQYSICQQNPYNNLVSLPAATQTDPYPQPNTVQNQSPSNPGFDGTLNQLLMSKILGIPGLQKIFDPNTKLFNQNGQEIQRHTNTGTGPSVVNNYFIVPPEFFTLNDTKVKSNNTLKRKRVNSTKKASQIKTKAKTAEQDNDVNKLTDNDEHKNIGRTKKRKRKHKQNKASDKILVENVETNNDHISDAARIVKKTKRRRKQEPKTKPAKITTSEKESETEKDINSNEKKRRKRPRKLRTQSKGDKEESYETPIDIEDTKVTKGNSSVKKKKGKIEAKTRPENSSDGNEEKTKNAIEFSHSSEELAQLKNIESPVDNQETTKDLTENRKTRNSKNSTPKKEDKPRQATAPITDDVLKSLFPYMYPGNYFYPNNFNFDQFYEPYLTNNSNKNKRRKNKTTSEDHRESPPNVVTIKLKPKKQEATTTLNRSEETTEAQIDSSNVEKTTEVAEPITDISMEIPHKVSPKEDSDESLIEPVIPKPEHTTRKPKIEMPPTVIEDLHGFLNMELGKEGIVPTIHNNGIIGDYYPIFDDDLYYASEENYYLKDLEDERHYYTTDRGHDEVVNRDRRKYDSYDKPRRPDVDIKDRLYCRRGLICKDRVKDFDEIDKNSIYYTQPKIKQKNNPTKTENDREVLFQTPPLLEKPDFRTKKIENDHSESNSDDSKHPIYTSQSAERISDISNIHSNIDSPKFDRLVNIKSEIRKEKGLSASTTPGNDRIETVFAKTRVVKYGVGKDESEENASVRIPVDEGVEDNKRYGDDQTTYVIAKSLGQIDDYYWR